MKTLEGKEFKYAEPNEVIDFLKSQKKEVITAPPSKLSFVLENETPFLRITNGTIKEYHIRKSCMKKILNWNNIPFEDKGFLSDDTLIAICNDSLRTIKAREVDVRLVDNEVLTITSQFYSMLTNLEVIKAVSNAGITKISINDYLMRIYTEERFKTDPIVGDTCGFGLNIFNSESGFSALGIQHFILRYVCTNGATMPLNMLFEKENHYGVKKEVLINFLHKQFERVEPSRKYIIFALKKSNDEPAKKYFNQYCYKIDTVIGKWKSKKFFEEFDVELSKYDLFNFITDKAKSFDILKRYQLERLAGDLIMN
jgi:hypothetical protein